MDLLVQCGIVKTGTIRCLCSVLGQNCCGQNGTDKMVYGQNGIRSDGQNGIGQDGTDKMVRIK